jgi:hypothetical protein
VPPKDWKILVNNAESHIPEHFIVKLVSIVQVNQITVYDVALCKYCHIVLLSLPVTVFGIPM